MNSHEVHNLSIECGKSNVAHNEWHTTIERGTQRATGVGADQAGAVGVRRVNRDRHCFHARRQLFRPATHPKLFIGCPNRVVIFAQSCSNLDQMTKSCSNFRCPRAIK